MNCSGLWYGHRRGDRIIMFGVTVLPAAATVAVTMAAREAELFPEMVVDAVIILIFITCLAGPLVTRYAARPIAAEHARVREEEKPRQG